MAVFFPLILASCLMLTNAFCNYQRFIASPLYSGLVSQALSIFLYTMLSKIKHGKEMAPLVNTFLEKLSQNRPLYHTQTSCISRCHTTFLPTNLYTAGQLVDRPCILTSWLLPLILHYSEPQGWTTSIPTCPLLKISIS